MPDNLLTHSRMSCAKTCLKKHYLRYELGLDRDRQSEPLRIGSAIHVGLDARAKSNAIEAAILLATMGYDLIPAWAEPEEWAVEREIVARLIAGYYWRWEQDEVEIVASEIGFRIPVINPDTLARSRTWEAAGVIDKIVRLPDGRLAIQEHKTVSEDLSEGSDYWLRLRLDQQISLYVLAARTLGYDVQTVLYDVIRKPSIRPKLVKGTRETPEQFGDRLIEDIGTRPDFYFARKEIPRLESDLEEFRAELWQQGRLLRECQLSGRWYRNTNQCLHPFRCPFADLCFSGVSVDPNNPPDGFVRVTNLHPELEGKIDPAQRPVPVSG